jgi:hypothetical protein
MHSNLLNHTHAYLHTNTVNAKTLTQGHLYQNLYVYINMADHVRHVCMHTQTQRMYNTLREISHFKASLSLRLALSLFSLSVTITQCPRGFTDLNVRAFFVSQNKMAKSGFPRQRATRECKSVDQEHQHDPTHARIHGTHVYARVRMCCQTLI